MKWYIVEYRKQGSVVYHDQLLPGLSESDVQEFLISYYESTAYDIFVSLADEVLQ
jgi:hypothetical protein